MKILISTIFQDAGDATRALEIARIIRDYKPISIDLDIGIISRGSKFDEIVKNQDFRLISAEPKIRYDNFHEEYKTKFGDIISDINIAKKLLLSEIDIYNKEKPDIILNGFFPISTVARKLIEKKIIGISFLPLPLVNSFIHDVTQFPEDIYLSKLSKSVQKRLLDFLPTKLKLNNPAIKHKTINRAVKELGYSLHFTNIFDLLSSNYYFVNDYPEFYTSSNYSKNIIFTGPLIPVSKKSTTLDKIFANVLSPKNKLLKIFCSLGSVGEKKYLYTIVDMLNTDIGKNFSGILLVPKEICSLTEIATKLKNNNVVITDQFVPAEEINKKMDIVICHGGQGTLQTAIKSGTPIIGVAMQPEQEINLQHLEKYGAAIRVPRDRWTELTILNAIKTITNDSNYKKKVIQLEKTAKNLDTNKIIGQSFWKIASIEKN